MPLDFSDRSPLFDCPRLCPPWTGAPAVRYKSTQEDFVVEELPLYEPAGIGTHVWLWIEKRGLTTHAAARTIAQKLKKNPLDAGIAGLKDAQAITRQWISFEHIPDGLDELSQQLNAPDGSLRLLKVSRHGNKLRMGHLRGNCFIICLRTDAGAAGAVESRAREVISLLKLNGIPNYYGEQRFGNTGANPALGKMLVLGDSAGFNAALAATGQARQARDLKMRNLLVNAFQAELFNRVLSERIRELGKLYAGDLAFLHRNGAVFKIATPEDAAKEQPRADAHEISPSGPIFGPKMPQPEGLPGEIEARVLSAAGVALADFGRKEAERQPGARRALRIFFLDEPEASADNDAVILRFALPSGAYATEVLQEIDVLRS